MQNAFAIISSLHRASVNDIENFAERQMTEQAWVMLELHFQDLGGYLQQRDQYLQRRDLLVSLLQSTQDQLQNMKGLL